MDEQKSTLRGSENTLQTALPGAVVDWIWTRACSVEPENQGEYARPCAVKINMKHDRVRERAM